MQKVGKDIQAAAYWQARGESYAEEMFNDYHAHRMAVARSLVDRCDQDKATVLDFGCGDGEMLRWFPRAGKVIGIEPDELLLRKAEEKMPNAVILKGSVEKLREIESNSTDIVLCLNVMAYFTDAEEHEFYTQLRRLMRKGGRFIVTHSNSLFDMFSLNAFTAEFFRDQFGCVVDELLTKAGDKSRISYNVRENPLAYASKLSRYGFNEIAQEFINYHEVPPALGRHTTYRDTLAVPADERWMLMFRCSTYASMSVLVDGS